MSAQFQRINPTIPLVDVMPGLLNPGHEITFIGSTSINASRFSINLQCGPNTSPRDDVALHLTADFTRQLFVRNSIHSMSWGMEENQGGMPLYPGQQFHITIVIEASQFMIAVNQTAFKMNHRMPYQRITHLTIDGDVLINEIKHRPYGATLPGGYAAGYPPNTAPGYPSNTAPYPTGGYAPSSQGYPPNNNNYVQPNQKSSGPLGQLGTALGGGALGAAIAARSVKPKKILKHQKKMAKKAMKYGVPIAGAGVGAYALGKVLHHGHHRHHGHHWGSSSSSSSSSSS